MALEFKRTCQQIGGSKGVITPPEILTALDVDLGDVCVLRYYEKEKIIDGKKVKWKYCSFWKEKKKKKGE